MTSRFVLLVVAFFLAGCTGRGEPQPIWVGHVAALTGPDRHASEAAARGIRLAVEEFNKDLENGIGRPFKVIHSDAHGSLDALEAEAVRLVTVNRVAFLVGGSTAEEVERLDRARVPVLTPIGARTRSMSDNVFCVGLPPAQQAKVLAQFAALELDVAHVLVIQDQRHEQSADRAVQFVREFRAAREKKVPKTAGVARLVRFNKASDLPKLVEDSSKAEQDTAPQAILFAGSADDLPEIRPTPLPILFAGEPGGGQGLKPTHSAGQKLYFVTPFTTQAEVPRIVDFDKRFQQAFQEGADVHAALAYESMKLLYAAILLSKDASTPAPIRDELKRLKDVHGLAGPLSFTPERQMQRPAFVMSLEDGGTRIVKRYEAEQ